MRHIALQRRVLLLHSGASCLVANRCQVHNNRLDTRRNGIALFFRQTETFGGQLVRMVRLIALLTKGRGHGVQFALQRGSVLATGTTTAAAAVGVHWSSSAAVHHCDI